MGGDVTALELNVAFSNAGLLGTSSVPFGDLVLTNFTGGLSEFSGLTVSEFLALAETCLGDGSCPSGAGNVDGLAGNLSFSFALGTVTAFADDHLTLLATTASMPEPSSLLLLAPGLAIIGFLVDGCIRVNSGIPLLRV